MLEINTMLVPAIPACLRANSKLVNLSSATPIPFVRNNFFATKSNNSNFFQSLLIIKNFSLVIKLESKKVLLPVFSTITYFGFLREQKKSH